MNRYSLGGHGDGEYEVGSNDAVLKNKLGITSVSEIAVAESLALARAKASTLEWFEDTTPISAKLLCELHEGWLGDIYVFAGKYRTVNLSKPGITFCAAAYIEEKMASFEEDLLLNLTPCVDLTLIEVCNRVARVHSELILIHPFREGNGRLARWAAELMILQAGFSAPNYDSFVQNEAEARSKYFAALRKGFLDDDVADLSQLFQSWTNAESGAP